MRSTKSEVRNTKEEMRGTRSEVGNMKEAVQTTNNQPPTANAFNRDLQRELQKQQRKLSNLEVDITKASNEKLRLEVAMAAPENFSNRQKFAALEADYVKAQVSLSTLNNEYEELFEKVMELESKSV